MTRYLPPGMVEHIDKIADLGLGGERRVITCAFITTCSFSRFPPGLRPAETMAMLNIYLDTATTCVHKARGVIDKYMGSDMMVLFNTQLNPESAHSQAAVEMALDMRAAFEALYRRIGADPAAHHYAIGIHTGVATLGNVGSLRRRSFTALGDTINLARRVQESAGPGQILLTGDAAEFLHTGPDSALRLEARPALQARGRQQATPIFEVIRA
jgi:class 3 adenylate cyclase